MLRNLHEYWAANLLYMMGEGLGLAHISFLIGASICLSPKCWGFSGNLIPFWGLSSSTRFHELCPVLDCWVEPLRGQLCYLLVCKYNRMSLIVSGIDTCPLDISYVGSRIVWPVSLSLLHCCIPVRTNSGSKILWVCWCPSLATSCAA